MVTQVQLYGGHWLGPAAARSMERVRRQIGHWLQITEAGRTWDEQNKHFQIFQRNGSPIALSPDGPPKGNGPSVHQLGGAIDTNEGQRIVGTLEDHGWRRTVYRGGKLVEPWHFEYFEHLDNHRGEFVALTQGADGVWRIGDNEENELDAREKEMFGRMHDALVARTGDGGMYYKTDALTGVIRGEVGGKLDGIAGGNILFPGAKYLMANALANNQATIMEMLRAIQAGQGQDDGDGVPGVDVAALLEASEARISRAVQDSLQAFSIGVRADMIATLQVELSQVEGVTDDRVARVVREVFERAFAPQAIQALTP